MEKRKPHFDLDRVKTLIEQGSYRVTLSALKGALDDFDIDETDVLLEHVLQLRIKDFYKSMTTRQDSTIWQDVYRPWVGEFRAYVKVQIDEDKSVIISFKSM